MKSIKKMNEKQLREAKVIWPKDENELLQYIRDLTQRDHDYGTCVYAMSMAALATFYYVSYLIGVTGFQASCADIDFIKRSRHLEYGFRLMNYENVLYPQYFNNKEYFPSAMDILLENKDMFLKEAKKKLKNDKACVEVRTHWEWIIKKLEEK